MRRGEPIHTSNLTKIQRYILLETATDKTVAAVQITGPGYSAGVRRYRAVHSLIGMGFLSLVGLSEDYQKADGSEIIRKEVIAVKSVSTAADENRENFRKHY